MFSGGAGASILQDDAEVPLAINRSKRTHSTLGFKFENDGKNSQRLKRSYSSLNAFELDEFAVALSKLAEPDNLHVVENEKYPTNLTEFCQEAYRILDGIHSNRYINYASTTVLLSSILLSFIVSFAQTEPNLMTIPATCANPVCNNDVRICPGSMVCEPVADASLEKINVVIIYLFTAEYLSKLLTCWSVSPRDWGYTHVLHESARMNIVSLYFNYVLKFKNLVDLLTILPYYAMLEVTDANSNATLFLRVFRFIKLVRIIKGLKRCESAYRVVLILIETMRNSFLALGVMFGGLAVAMIFFGSIIYAVEGGTFQATEEYPQGAYMRRAINGVDMEVSPFKSIPTCFYWVMITGTTVGYGDLVPTSWVGRMISCVVCVVGIIMLALPIGIIGSSFTEQYLTYVRGMDIKDNLKIDMMDEGNMIELFNMIDVDATGIITIFQLKDAFDAGGVKLNESKLTKVFAQADSGRDGNITQRDFINFCKEIQGFILSSHEIATTAETEILLPPMDDESIVNLFHLVDERQDGLVDLTELKSAFQKMGLQVEAKKLKELFQSAATSDDGLTMEEFKTLIQSKRQKSSKFEIGVPFAPGSLTKEKRETMGLISDRESGGCRGNGGMGMGGRTNKWIYQPSEDETDGAADDVVVECIPMQTSSAAAESEAAAAISSTARSPVSFPAAGVEGVEPQHFIPTIPGPGTDALQEESDDGSRELHHPSAQLNPNRNNSDGVSSDPAFAGTLVLATATATTSTPVTALKPASSPASAALLLQRVAELQSSEEEARRERSQLDKEICQWDEQARQMVEQVRLLQEQCRAARALRDQADRRIEEAWDERNEIDSQLAEIMMLLGAPQHPLFRDVDPQESRLEIGIHSRDE